MQICSNRHDEVAFMGHMLMDCPFCKMMDEKDETILRLRQRIDSLEQVVDDRDKEIFETKEKLNDLEISKAMRR